MEDTLAMARLDARALVRVSGPDARSFLHGLLTQDVQGLKPAELRYGALLTPQGRLLYDLFLVGEAEGVLLDVAAEHRDALVARLDLYRLRARVAVSAVGGSVDAAWSPGRGGAGEPGAGWSRDPRLAGLGWRRYGDGAVGGGENGYDAHRLALGVTDTPRDAGDDRAYPMEVNLDLLNGIDFKKGCFVGQETTSRMKRRGTLKTRLTPLVYDGPAPPAGSEITAGELRAGEMRSGADGRGMALLRLDRALGVTLEVDGRVARADPPSWLATALEASQTSDHPAAE